MPNISTQINLDWAARLTKPLRVAARRFLFGPPVNRTIFLIDGFNLYHSVRDASKSLGLSGRGTRWLDIAGMCASYLSAIGHNSQIAGIYYFSAIATHLLAFDPDIEKRHRAYAKCLTDTGISVEFARFKKKKILCPHCATNITRREEKETDVAIGCIFLVFTHGSASSLLSLELILKGCARRTLLRPKPAQSASRSLLCIQLKRFSWSYSFGLNSLRSSATARSICFCAHASTCACTSSCVSASNSASASVRSSPSPSESL